MKLKSFCSCLIGAVSIFALSGTCDVYAVTPDYSYSFDGDKGNAIAIERKAFYDDSALVSSDGSSFKYKEGMLGECLYMNGDEALKLPVQITSESYTVSYWIKPDIITNCTPSLMITPYTFFDEKFINVTLAVDNLSPNIWTHMMEPYDERQSTGMPGLLTVDEWTHITMVVNEDMPTELLRDYDIFIDENYTPVALYINGFLISVGKVPKSICIDSTQYWFGVNIWDDLYKGCVDELYFYNSALSEEEVKEVYIASGGDPDAKKPVGSTNQNNSQHGMRPNGGSLSDDYVEIAQGSISGSNNYLNKDNSAPIAYQGTDTTTDIYADFAMALGFGILLIGVGLIIKYYYSNKNSYT